MNQSITLRLLRYFEVLGSELNFRRAAERLFVSQPALSAAIRQLEQQVGDRLFDRDTHSVALTEVGQQWLPHVRAALREVDAAIEVAASLVNHGHVRVGYLIGTGADLLFELLDGVDQHLPNITAESVEYNFDDPTAGLASGAVDIALLRPPVEIPDAETAVVSEERWMACLPRAHRFAGRESIAIEELLDEPIVAAPESAGVWRDYWLAADLRDGRPADVAAVAATYESEVTLVARGIGLSFTVSSMVRLYSRPGVQFVPITGRPVTYTALAWRPSRLSGAGRQLLRYMLEGVNSRR